MKKNNKEKKNLSKKNIFKEKSSENAISQEKDAAIDESVSSDENTIEMLKKELTDNKDEKLRILADMENLRKRSEKEKIDSIKFGSANLARDILSPCDNLTRALDSLSEEEKMNIKNHGLIDGLKMVHQEIISILSKHGVKKINALNTKFDHNFHQAMMEIDDEETESGIVIKELQAGYIMHDRLLRPSMVGVSKKKEKKIEDEKQS